jgi:hypothetical protein
MSFNIQRKGSLSKRLHVYAILVAVAIFISAWALAQTDPGTWRRDPPQNKPMEQRLERAAAAVVESNASLDPVGTCDISYPRNQNEYRALDGNGVIYITMLTKDRTKLPIQRVSIVSDGKMNLLTPIHTILTDQTGSQTLPVKAFGPYRTDILCLFPVSLRLKPGSVIVDLSGNAGRFNVMTFSATVPPFIKEIMTESIPGKGPSEQILAQLIREQIEGVLDVPRPDRSKPGSEKELAEITARGKKLAQYDQAAWYATDAFREIKPDPTKTSVYIATEQNGRWTVSFGRLNEKQDKFLVVYEAAQQEDPMKFKINELATPREESGFLLAGAKAIGAARIDFGNKARRYNVSALPAPSGRIYVYFLAAQTDLKSYPVGGDARYLISSDGTKIIEKRNMHMAVAEYRVPDSGKVENSFHTAALDDIPEDSDVFHVLVRKPTADELVLTPNYVYKIQVDGTIQYLIKTEASMKILKPKSD